MTNLTSDQYEAEVANARAKYTPGSTAALDRMSAWAEIHGVYSLLWVHQLEFDRKGIVPSAKALAFRSDAEALLANAKSKLVGLSISSGSAVTSASFASGAAYDYIQLTKHEAGLDEGGV